MAKFSDLPAEVLLDIFIRMLPKDLLLNIRRVNRTSFACITQNERYIAERIVKTRYPFFQNLCRIPSKLDTTMRELGTILSPTEDSAIQAWPTSVVQEVIPEHFPTEIGKISLDIFNVGEYCFCPACHLDKFHWELLIEYPCPTLRRAFGVLGPSAKSMDAVLDYLASRPLLHASLISLMSRFHGRHFSELRKARKRCIQIDPLESDQWTDDKAIKYSAGWDPKDIWPWHFYTLKEELKRTSKAKTHKEIIENAIKRYHENKDNPERGFIKVRFITDDDGGKDWYHMTISRTENPRRKMHLGFPISGANKEHYLYQSFC